MTLLKANINSNKKSKRDLACSSNQIVCRWAGVIDSKYMYVAQNTTHRKENIAMIVKQQSHKYNGFDMKCNKKILLCKNIAVDGLNKE